MAPHRFGLRLNTGHGVKDGDGAVEHAERTLYFNREVHVSGGVDDVDLVAVPLTGGSGRGDGDTALLLLDHPVHGGGAFVHFTDLVVLTGVEQDALSRRRLTGVDVGHNANIADVFEGDYTVSHEKISLITSGSGRKPCWTLPSFECHPCASPRHQCRCWRQ